MTRPSQLFAAYWTPSRIRATVCSVELNGAWRLVQWRRINADGTQSFPLGQDAQGMLLYTDDGYMSAMMTAGDRPKIDGGDPLGGDPQARATAYSTCLAYSGSWHRQGDTVIHRLTDSLYPNWSGTVQPRSIENRDGELILRTPQDGPGGVVNEIVWARPRPGAN
jgi:Lipocalin-like domain